MLRNVLIIGRKDLREFWNNFYLRLSLTTFPAFITFLASMIVITVGIYKKIPIFLYTNSLNGSGNIIILSIHLVLPYFLLSVSIMPVVLSTYSLIGEKTGNTIEMLLAAPVTDHEILFGKILAVLFPTVLLFFASFGFFILFIELVTFKLLGSFFLLDSFSILVICFTGPLYALLSTTLGIAVSSRVNDIKAAQQIGSIVLIPIIGMLVYLQYTLSFIFILYFSFALLLSDIAIFFISTKLFNREEILIRWNK